MATPRRDDPGMPRRSSSRLKRKKEEDTSQPTKKQAHLKEEPAMELDPIGTTQAASTQVKRKKPYTTQRSSSRLKGKRDRDQPPVERQEHQPPMKSLDEALPGTSQDADTRETPATKRQQEPQSSSIPTRSQFFYIKDNVGLNWVNLARMLGFSEPDIEVFKDMHKNPKESCMAMLTDWKQNTGVEGTVDILKEGLRNAGLNIIADNLDLYTNTYRVEKLTSYTWPASDNERITEQEKQKKRETQKAGIDNQTGESQHIVKEVERKVQQYMEKNYPGLKRENQEAASTSDDPVNTCMSPESNIGEISLRFHEKIHGTQISISGNGTVAQSRDSFSNSICFSKMPIKIGEKVNFKIIDSQAHDDSLRFGVTSRSPDSILVEDLPPHSYPDLAEWSRFWVKPLPGSQAHQGCVVTFSVEESGKVTFAVDGEDKGLFFSGVDVSKPLWAVVDVHGSARAVQFVGEQAACEAFDQRIHVGDQVQLRELQMERLLVLQESHGGFVSEMMEAKGEVGIVGRIDNDGDMHVFFPSISKGWCIAHAALRKVKRPDIRANAIFLGDVVKITEDLEKLKSVQQEKDLWKDGMEKTIGKTARVQAISRKNGDVDLRVSGTDWTFDPLVVERSKAEIQGEMCDQDLHYWKRGVSKVCVKCSECTAAGAKCSMKGKPLRPPGSCCGCRSNNAGCAECGICKSCAGEESDDDTVLDHLRQALLRPIIAQTLRETLSSLISGGAKDEDTEHFRKGDLVRLIKDHERLKTLQKGHGGYVDDMESCLGKTGCVRKVRQSGLVQVEFLHVAKSYWYNPAALSKVSSEEQEISAVHQLKQGDCVKVTVDAETFQANQSGHGGNVDNMAEVLETVGVVSYIDLDGDPFTCFLNGTRWPINPASLEKVNLEDNMYTGVDSSSQLKVDDWVKVDADKARIKRVQTAKATIDWDEAFYAAAGKVGRVTSIDPSNKIVRVSIDDSGFPLDSELVKRASLADLQEHFSLSQDSDFARGDLVRISVSLDELKHLQEGHGGYKPDMEKVMAETGSVCFIDFEGDIYVRFGLGRLCFNPAALSKETALEDKFYVGDLVRIESDLSKFKALQTQEHGGYVEQMAETCGKAGRLVSIVDSEKMRVKVQGRAWIYNPDLLTRMGNPRAVTADWKSATICARGKHDWSRGRCLVCVMCGECTEDGKLCSALRKLDTTLAAGSVAGCGYGHAGCDDCGCCKRCAGEDLEEIDLLQSDELKGTIIKILKDEVGKRLAVDDVKTVLTKHRLSESSEELKEGRKKMLDLLNEMGEVIEMMRKNKDPDSIEQVLRAVDQHIDTPRNDSSPVERKQIGDYLANIGAAEALKEYGCFLFSQEVQIESTYGRISSESSKKFFYDVFNGCAYASLEFARAAGRSGLLQMTVQELEQRHEMKESDDKQEWIRTLVCILGNCARVPENRDYFTDTGAVDLLKKQLQASNEDMVLKVVIFSCLAHCLDDEKLETIQLQTEDVEFIVKKLTQAVGDAKHECRGYENKKWEAVDLVRDLTALSRHVGNKHEFVRKGVTDPLIQLIESGNDTEKECAMLCVQRFAITVESIRETILNETRVVEVLTALQTQDQIYAVQAAARKTLKCLRNEPSST